MCEVLGDENLFKIIIAVAKEWIMRNNEPWIPQDNDPKQCSLLEWPSRSSDTNPIENLK
jgi:hypothetical protein